MIKINNSDIENRINYAREIVNEFYTNNDFDPLDVLKGGSGYPDASPDNLKLYNAAAAFLDSILDAYKELDKIIYRGKERGLYI